MFRTSGRGSRNAYFPDDVDWKSIDHELMYMVLSFPSEDESAKRLVDAASDIAHPPDYEDWFEERKFHYSALGLVACKLSDDLCTRYNIGKKTYNDWNPVDSLKRELESATKKTARRFERHTDFVNRVLGK